MGSDFNIKKIILDMPAAMIAAVVQDKIFTTDKAGNAKINEEVLDQLGGLVNLGKKSGKKDEAWWQICKAHLKPDEYQKFSEFLHRLTVQQREDFVWTVAIMASELLNTTGSYNKMVANLIKYFRNLLAMENDEDRINALIDDNMIKAADEYTDEKNKKEFDIRDAFEKVGSFIKDTHQSGNQALYDTAAKMRRVNKKLKKISKKIKKGETNESRKRIF